MGRRQDKPPAIAAGGAPQVPVAAAPELAMGLNKYFSPSLQALTGGTMDAPVAEPIPARSSLPGEGRSESTVPTGPEETPAPNPVRVHGKSLFIRHRQMTFVGAAPKAEE